MADFFAAPVPFWVNAVSTVLILSLFAALRYAVLHGTPSKAKPKAFS
ncbi:hypothetical protein FACS1894103_0660 [Campylobacterota bacterium]|nr:hypothetical protein FACS1894103_0450 [Campylobacterota bacterium]GHV58712.1 hypothetical protein FACS1894103_0660 [Campylobacterota bacterium]